MATDKLLPILPFSRPLPRYDEFCNVKSRVYTLCRRRRRRITIDEADRFADEYAVDETHHVAIASYFFDFNHAHGIPPANIDPEKSNAAVKHAALVLDVCKKRDRRKPTMLELAVKHDVHEKSIPRFMHYAGYRKHKGRWIPLDADRHLKSFYAKMAAHRAWLEGNSARCAWVSYPEGKVDLEAICALGIGLQWKGPKINDSYTGRVNGAYSCLSRLGLPGVGNYLMEKPSALAHLLSQEVTLELVNGYPALVFPNGQRVFLHKRNYLMAHGMIALPPGTELHHIDGKPKNASAVNTVAVLRPEHTAYHSRKG